MLQSLKDLRGYRIHATDGEIGQIDDFYFDGRAWVIRYLVVDTGDWLTGRRVLLSPVALEGVERTGQAVRVKLTREQVQNSPHIDVAQTISRQQETDYFDYFGWPYYWAGSGLMGMGTVPGALAGVPGVPPPSAEQTRQENPLEKDNDLQSAKEVTGYRVEARDGDAGEVADFLVEDADWTIHYIVVDTTRWWPGGEVIMAPTWVTQIDWSQRRAAVDLTRETIQKSPEFDASTILPRRQ
jgi:hypothetical protein